jgi:hypothetical protein
MGNHTNADGLQVQHGEQDVARVGGVDAPSKRLVVDFVFDDLPSFTADLNNNGTKNGFFGGDANVPAGAFITNAYIVVTTAFAGGTSYNIGLYDSAGSALDVDGIDAAVATAALAANKAVVCNGASVGGTVTEASDGFIVIAATGTYTAGAAKLVIEYIET